MPNPAAMPEHGIFSRSRQQDSRNQPISSAASAVVLLHPAQVLSAGLQSESLFKISSDGPNSVGFTKQQAFPLGRQDYHSELDGGPIAIYYSDNNMV